MLDSPHGLSSSFCRLAIWGSGCQMGPFCLALTLDCLEISLIPFVWGKAGPLLDSICCITILSAEFWAPRKSLSPFWGVTAPDFSYLFWSVIFFSKAPRLLTALWFPFGLYVGEVLFFLIKFSRFFKLSCPTCWPFGICGELTDSSRLWALLPAFLSEIYLIMLMSAAALGVYWPEFWVLLAWIFCKRSFTDFELFKRF